MKPAPFNSSSPTTIDAALTDLAQDNSKAMAGGQSLGPMMNLRLARPSQVTTLNHINDLQNVRLQDGRLFIGAGVTHGRIETCDTPHPMPQMLRHVASNIAYRAVRNRGTLGGSLAHADPAADWVTTMTALDATLHITGPDKAQRAVPMTQFMQGAYRTVLDPGELITEIELDADTDDLGWGYYKVCRKVGEFADAIGAFVVRPQKGYIRLVAGATETAPLVLSEMGAHIAQSASHPGDAALAQAVAQALPNADAVKQHLLTTALSRAIEQVLPK